MIEFQPWPKIARLNRDMIITEKIDGTNAAIGIVPFTVDLMITAPDGVFVVADEIDSFANAKLIYAQSRTRIITSEQDNHGFAKWVEDNAALLVDSLGDGLHFGEWWGSGIQRGYGLTKGEKRFSLFNTPRYGDPTKVDISPLKSIGMDIVPVLYYGAFSELAIKRSLERLKEDGSRAAPGFMDPEGIIVFHVASRTPFKVTIKGDEKPKGSTE
jgi:hypothetical protein